jgi:putative PIN family toxin of toxin-antitoxin system
MIRAVLDTNIIVSALLTPEGPTALILTLATSKKFRCCISESLLQEYRDVLGRPEFHLDQQRIARLMRSLERSAVVVVPRKILQIASDPDDDKVMECALEARADFVVTGNLRHFPTQFQDIRVIAPRQFLTILASLPA